MKDIDMGKEYIIPSPGYRSDRDRSAVPGQHRDPEEPRFRRTRSVLFVALAVLELTS
ncbi:ATP-binding cassette, sub-family C (CFTR/MRP), member 5, isoform CRA_b [Mus musculus]|nr:ATP-binding cassette, sub-family C (CFTR/MRP), member 5, isoform CRA_b [Mus musculus]